MSDKENMEVFERIWYADIITKAEPLYSMAISIAEIWSDHNKNVVGGCEGARYIQLNYLLLNRLTNKWEEILIEHINNIQCVPLNARLPVIFKELREKHKGSCVIIKIINKIANKILLDITDVPAPIEIKNVIVVNQPQCQ